jgi:hypothetical protein
MKKTRIESNTLYRVRTRSDDGRGTCEILIYPIVKQAGGKITYQITDGREFTEHTKDLLATGNRGSRAEAIEAYLTHYRKDVEEATANLHSAAQSYAYRAERLDDAEQRIVAMQREVTI